MNNMQPVIYYCCIAVFLFAVVHGGGSKSEEKPRGSLQAKNIFDAAMNIENNPSIQISGDLDVDAIKRQVRRRNNRRRKNRKSSNRKTEENPVSLDDPKQIFQDAIRHMFGFEHMVTAPDTVQDTKSILVDPAFDTTGSERGNDQRKQSRKVRDFMPQPPDFMVELYRTYSQDKDLMLLHSRSIGNTVRSFFPTPADPLLTDRERGKPITISPIDGIADGTESQRTKKMSQIPVFLFNLTAIPSPETIVEAEIRLDGISKSIEYKSQTSENSTISDAKNDSSSSVEWKMIAAIYKLSTTNCIDEIDCVGRNTKIFIRVGKSTILSSRAATAWTASNFVRIAKKARRPNHVMIVRFEPENTDGLSRQSRHTENEQTDSYDLPMSFTVADSERIKRDSELFHKNKSPSPDNWFDTNADHIPAIPILIIYCNDSRTAVSDKIPTAPFVWKALENVTSIIKRSRRSAPDDSPSAKKRDSRNSESDIAIRKNRPQVVNKVKEENEKSKSNKIQSKPNRERKRKRNCSKRRRKRGECPGSKKIKLHPSLANKQAETKCGRKSLHVDFEDIEWSNWIIYPMTFDAYYCTGMCELTQMLNKGATNHAVVQALLRAEGRNDVPAPCCVPDKLMPLAVLFWDAQKNVVMKEYPSMSVETCMCR